MKFYKGAKAEKSAEFERLPADGYVCKIIKAREEEYSWGSVLVVAFDIAEGEYEGFYQKNLNSQVEGNKKWKGIYRITIPNESGNYFESESKNFNSFVYALNESNKNFDFFGHEAECNKKDYKFLNGKLLGIVFRNKEWEYDGKTGWFTEPFKPYTVDEIRNGEFKPAKDKPLKTGSGSASTSSTEDFKEIEVAEDDLPF